MKGVSQRLRSRREEIGANGLQSLVLPDRVELVSSLVERQPSTTLLSRPNGERLVVGDYVRVIETEIEGLTEVASSGLACIRLYSGRPDRV